MNKAVGWMTKRVRHIHMIGIGGAGMVGIAEVLSNLGYEVSGSDNQDSKELRHLRQLGIAVSIGHNSGNIDECDVLVCSGAIGQDNPELTAAAAKRIPVLSRAEMLAELMRLRQGIAVAGTHGKTTTTSIIASLLGDGGLDPTYVIGGLLNRTRSSARLGTGRYLIAEADESDGSFLHLQPMMSVLTNIDRDHLDAFGGDYAHLRSCFLEFVHRLPFYGLLIWCRDHPDLAAMQSDFARPSLSYGFSDDADYHVRMLPSAPGSASRFQVRPAGTKEYCELTINMPGRHNVLNAVAAFAVADQLGVPQSTIIASMKRFQGVARRCQILGELPIRNGSVHVIDDYAHHPNELKETIQAVQDSWPGNRLVAVFQPHRYTRTRDLFEDFVHILAKLEVVVLLDVYAAGEEPIVGADTPSLCRALRLLGKTEPIYAVDRSETSEILNNLLHDGDVLLIMGAGDISFLGAELWRSAHEPVVESGGAS